MSAISKSLALKRLQEAHALIRSTKSWRKMHANDRKAIRATLILLDMMVASLEKSGHLSPDQGEGVSRDVPNVLSDALRE